MKNLTYLLLFFLGICTFVACDDTETYSDMKDKERAAINQYLKDSAVTVISETQFAAQNYTTDVSKNEWVLFNSTGVYMQVIREGCGEKIQDGETVTVLCRFTERNLQTDTIEASNILWAERYYWVDKMSVTNTSGTFTGYLVSGQSTLMWAHSLSTTAAPEGWLVPLSYVKVGRPATEDEDIAKVRLIVPHDQGHYTATLYVTPYLYDITYERGR